MDTSQSDENAKPGQYGYIEILSVPIEEAIDTGEPPQMPPDEVFQKILEEYDISPPDHTNPS